MNLKNELTHPVEVLLYKCVLPEEIKNIRREDIDSENCLVTLTMNGKLRFVEIQPEYMEVLLKAEYPLDVREVNNPKFYFQVGILNMCRKEHKNPEFFKNYIFADIKYLSEKEWDWLERIYEVEQ
jgi:hypothetical protein